MSSLNTDSERNQAFHDFTSLFVQRNPYYGVKSRSSWKLKHKPLCDLPVWSHLLQKYWVGTLARWYPEFSALDIDRRSLEDVKRLREELELDYTNSMLMRSESRDSYHLLIRPEYNGKPPTANLLNSIFENYARLKNIEIYPKTHKVFRLPFGKYQRPLDPEYAHLRDWKELFYWFLKLDSFNLKEVNLQQLDFEFPPLEKPGIPMVQDEAQGLLDEGLQLPSSRHDSQFKVLFYLWRNNIPPDQAQEVVWNWIKAKHNGLSKDILRNPQAVRKEISRQANRVWGKYSFNRVYPDRIHNRHGGWIARHDIPDLVEATGGSKPKLKFLFNLIKFSYPRKQRRLIRLHSDELMKWTSGNPQRYQKRLNELQEKGIIKSRTSGYMTGAFSKGIELDWNWRTSQEAVLYDGRAVETLGDTLKQTFKPQEFREILESKGKISRVQTWRLIKEFYEKG